VSADGEPQLTIDALARRVGMTVRNIRAHQSRGLLPPPEVRGRTGYYGPDHVARLELVQELQADGFNLDLIRRLLRDAGGSSAEVLRFKHALSAPFGDEQPQVVGLADFAREWRNSDPALLARAEALGIVRVREEGQVEVRSPRLTRAAAELTRLGISLEQALEVAARVREQAERISDAYIALFLESVWEPFQRAGSPEERWPEVLDALERLRPLASESVLALFGLAMGDAVEQAFGRELARLGERREAG
jgi:DNA-binding transcriptional MerR regulator